MPTLEELLEQSVELEKKKQEILKVQNELAEQTRIITAAIQEEKKKKELEKTQVLIIEKVANGWVTLDTNGTPRTDVLDILRHTPSREYAYSIQRNLISIMYWNQFLESIKNVPNLEITYLDKNKEQLEKYFSEKLWSVSKGTKSILIRKAERNNNIGLMSKIPSAAWDTNVKSFTVPYSEGWRVIQVLPISNDVEYTPEVLELIESQVLQRQKMDEVAMKQDADIPNPFINGFELKPFQKAGVFFIMTALGEKIPEKPKPKVSDW